uniref:C2H2-type domain-containing protein n=1 Tax=Anopheles atroparvus TaxID=41427 RepID=A0AAG5CR08_ANOAO
MDSSQQVLNSEEYNIDNIIESAVDELLLQNVAAHSDYDDIDVLLLSLCRLCAREASQLIKPSDVYWMLICDLKINGIGGSIAGTSICDNCVKVLEEIQQFRCLCEDGQKRIITMLTQQNLLPDFLNLDFTDEKSDPTDVFSPPVVETQHHDGDVADSSDHEPQTVAKSIDEASESTAAHKEHARSPSKRGHTYNRPRQAALKVKELVKSLASAESEPDSTDSEEFRPEGETERHSTTESEPDSFKTKLIKASNKRNKKPKPAAGGSGNKTSAKRLQSRRRMVDGRLQWVCLDCELVFESCVKLKKHRRNCELVGSKQSKRYGEFTCETCGVVLSTFASLCLHRYKHETAATGEKNNKEKPEKVCHVCGKLFRTARLLNKHLAIHVDEKRYVCHICDKRFAGKRYLRNHLDVHSDSRQHECTTCGKLCTTSTSLRNHRETHKPNYLRQQCMVCSKRFAHPYRLRKHMMIHTEEFPYSCDVCKALFRKACQLSRHMEKGHAPPPPPAPSQPIELHSEMIDLDDLIVYQPEDDLVAMFDTMREEMHPLSQDGVMETIPQGQPFTSDHLLAEATREFTVQCFPDVHEADHEIYCFMEF